jgi:quaternary ammonium compound-resistance protein SugE
MPWLVLFFAGCAEVAWAVGLELSHGFTRPLPSLWTVVNMLVSSGILGLRLSAP